MAMFPRSAAQLLRMALTLVLATLALVTLWHIYVYYTYAPQTRDGKIRADVVALAADVSGRVDAVLVRDNQRVRRGQVLLTIDTARLTNAVAAAEAALATTEAKQYLTFGDSSDMAVGAVDPWYMYKGGGFTFQWAWASGYAAAQFV